MLLFLLSLVEKTFEFVGQLAEFGIQVKGNLGGGRHLHVGHHHPHHQKAVHKGAFDYDGHHDGKQGGEHPVDVQQRKEARKYYKRQKPCQKRNYHYSQGHHRCVLEQLFPVLEIDNHAVGGALECRLILVQKSVSKAALVNIIQCDMNKHLGKGDKEGHATRGLNALNFVFDYLPQLRKDFSFALIHNALCHA